MMQIGISVESLESLSQQTPALNTAVTAVQSYQDFCSKMLDSCFNFVASFAVTQGQMTLNPTETFVPLSALQQWFINFQRRLSQNPYFWKSWRLDASAGRIREGICISILGWMDTWLLFYRDTRQFITANPSEHYLILCPSWCVYLNLCFWTLQVEGLFPWPFCDNYKLLGGEVYKAGPLVLI